MKEPMNVYVNCECCGREMVKGLDCVTNANVCIKCRDVFSKLSRHDEQKEEGLREELEEFTARICPTELADDIRNTLEDMLSRHPTPAKEEPLAVLADRKGWWIRFISNNCDIATPYKWAIGLRKEDKLPDITNDNYWCGGADTYAAAEAKARAYLEALEDKGGE